VQGVYKSNSTLLILSIPVVIWDWLPDDPACMFIGYVHSKDLLPEIYQQPSTEENTPLKNWRSFRVVLEQRKSTLADRAFDFLRIDSLLQKYNVHYCPSVSKVYFRILVTFAVTLLFGVVAVSPLRFESTPPIKECCIFLTFSQFISGISLRYIWTSQAVSTDTISMSSYENLVEASVAAARTEVLQHIQKDFPKAVPLAEITANYRSLVEEVQGYCLNVPISFATYSSLKSKALGPYHPYMDTLRVRILLTVTPASSSDEWVDLARMAINNWPLSRQAILAATFYSPVYPLSLILWMLFLLAALWYLAESPHAECLRKYFSTLLRGSAQLLASWVKKLPNLFGRS
jgi:hypothetical protein